MMRFAYLGSGSKGNSALVQAGDTCVMIDCGLSLKEAEQRLERWELSGADLDAILVTHEHDDHIAGVAALAQRYDVPVWLTPGSLKGWKEPAQQELVRRLSPHEAFNIGSLRVQPYPVPHDAREPCQYVLGDGCSRVGVLTDAGSVTAHMRSVLSGCEALLVEFNHDLDMLMAGPYPMQLKRRVAGDRGHLSNKQAASLLSSIDCTRLQHLVLTHLSEINNTPEFARSAAAGALGCELEWIACAHQREGLAWRELR